MTKSLDPKNLNGRLYDAMSTLLDNFNEMQIREQVATITAIARIQVLFTKLRGDDDNSGAGSAVKRYSRAFQENATRKRAAGGRSTTQSAALLDPTADDDEDSDI